jgi:hypothetical protein
MLKRLISGALVLVVGAGVAFADEIRAIIIKVDGDKVTFAERKGKGQKGEEKTLSASDAKVVKGKFNMETKKVEAGDPLEGGLKNEAFSKIGEKGLGATIITDDANKKIIEIRVGGGKKKQ